MNELLKSQFAQLLRGKTDTQFQELVVFLFQLSHGESFTVVKQKHDKGSDGILGGDTVLAVYGPADYTLARFKKKIGEDYKSYAKNWKETHPKWMVVFNDELLANMIQFIDKKHSGAKRLGVPELMQEIEKLPWSKIQRLGEYLDIPTQILVHDLIGQVVVDLIRRDESDAANSERPFAIFIEEKIALNYDAVDIESATDQYFECLEYFNVTEEILHDHTSLALSSLRNRIRGDFNRLGGTFMERFVALIDRYTQEQQGDTLYTFAVTVLLTFFFEQCLIGVRTAKENSC